MTAKATLFGKRTFSSWLIENVGSVPIKRRQDSPEDTDNSIAMNSLTQVCNHPLRPFISSDIGFFSFPKALEEGDVICLFPEGMSKFQSKLSPLKSGGRPPMYLIIWTVVLFCFVG
jgi:glycerol-3-phosphate O-acyltransferase / dihydroxyacetone phosphate acyltransferase